MKKTISRNIAIVSAIFMIAFSVMLVTNYFKVSNSGALEMIERLKQANVEFGNDPQLQEQIRELDLLARRAYFTGIGRLRVGVAILLIMVAVFVVSLRIYFEKSKNIPDKDIDPIDDWAIQTKTRKSIVWIASGLVISGLIFALLASPYLRNLRPEQAEETEWVAFYLPDYEMMGLETTLATTAEIVETAEQVQAVEEAGTPTPVAPVAQVSNVTHNAFRGNSSLGMSAARNVPTSWNLATGENILWRVPMPRQAFNSPIINGNRIFFTGADQDVRELFAFELSTGRLLWRVPAVNIPGSPSTMPETTDDTGLGASTAATNGRVVAAMFGTGDVICVDMDGNLVWARNIGVPDISYGLSSSLLIFGNLLIIQYDTRNSPRVMALDLDTGNEVWSRARPERNSSWASPAIISVENRPQLIVIGNPGVTSYNPINGNVNWRVEVMSGEPAPAPAFASGVLVVATEYAQMTAINPVDGSILWQNNDILPEIASPVALRDFVFVATVYGVVASFDLHTGELIREMELNADFNASPMVVEGRIYLVCTRGRVFILSAQREFELINSFDTGEQTYATPAFIDRQIVIRTQSSLYSVMVPN
ncbi:MAG: PQQ-binding-like beta-propeller repeat protein [Bacteroidales bacterium]|nr:PQQ-binding-like beta-propeller repeat protein [Bacteroidales bacterium]